MIDTWIHICGCVGLFSLLFWILLVLFLFDDYGYKADIIIDKLLTIDSVVFLLAFITLLILKLIDWIWY